MCLTIARIFAFNCWSNTTSYIFQISISMLLTTKGGHMEKSNAWPCHKKGGLAAYKADLPADLGQNSSEQLYIFTQTWNSAKNYIIRCVGHHVDTLKHTSRLFSAKQRKCRNSHQDWVWTKINEFTSSCNCNLYSKHRAAERWALEFGSNTTENIFKHHGNFFKHLEKNWKLIRLVAKSLHDHCS